MGKFANDVMKFRLNAIDQAGKKFRKIVLDLDRAIISGRGAAPGTPVDTGRARGNWQANIGATPIAMATDKTDKDGKTTVAAAEDVILNLKIGDTIWLSNALDYIPVLEYGLYPNPPKKGTGKTESGFSTQAVGGFIAVAVADFGKFVEEVE